MLASFVKLFRRTFFCFIKRTYRMFLSWFWFTFDFLSGYRLSFRLRFLYNFIFSL